MKRYRILVILTVLLFLISFSSANSWIVPNNNSKEEATIQNTQEDSTLEENEGQQEILRKVPGEVIVKLKKGAISLSEGKIQADTSEIDFNSEGLKTLFTNYNVTEINKVFKSLEYINESSLPPEKQAQVKRLKEKLSDTFKIRVKDEDVDSIIKELRKNPDVIYAEPNYIYTIQIPPVCPVPLIIPNDPMYPDQWAHQNIHSEAGWEITTGNPDIKIAIIDTGVDWQHPDLNANIWQNLAEDVDADRQTLELVGSEWLLDPGDLNGIDDDNNGYVDDLIGWDAVEIDINEYIALGYVPLEGEDYTVPDNDPMDFHSHGTHVSGIANAVTNNNTGIAGVSWDSSILSIRAGFAMGYYTGYGTIVYGFLEDDDIADAFTYAILADADVINMSWGGSESSLIYDAIQATYSENIVLIAAAGNSGTFNTTYAYPAVYEEVCAVAATLDSDLWTGYSNYGAWVDVCAPGGGLYESGILSTLPNASYGYHMGTSMACPHVVGLAGLIKGKYNSLNPTNNAIVNSIINSADNIDVLNPGFEGLLGSGRINVERAVSIPLVDGAPQDRRIYLHPQESQGFSVYVYNLTGNPVTYSWELDGEVVSTNSTYLHTASEIGDDILKAFVTLDGETNFYEWTIVTANTFTEGEVSGTWIQANSPYIVIDDITVPADQTLTIEPGVEVLFDGLFKFYVYGQLEAIGESSLTPVIESLAGHSGGGGSGLDELYQNLDEGIITFSRYQSLGEWLGIDFIDTNQDNKLEYCLIEYVASYGGGIYCEDSSIVIKHCTISNNFGLVSGGIYLLNSSASIENCTFVGNLLRGIVCNNSSPTITNNTLTATASNQARGIYCINNSSPIIENNTISYSGGNSKGIRCSYNSSPNISNNIIQNSGIGILFDLESTGTISNNTISNNGGGIWIFDSNSSMPIAITNNIISNNLNGGIKCENNSSPTTITNNIISNNTANFVAGGIDCTNSSPTINNNTIANNTVNHAAGGINCEDNSSPTITNNIISNNTASYAAGGIHCENNSAPAIINNTIANNATGYAAGGIQCNNNSFPAVMNSIIYFNDGGYFGQDSLGLENSNIAVSYSDIQGGWQGEGNISTDPMFVDSTNNNYLFLVNSPCINTGNPLSAYNDPDGSRNDMGAYGGPGASQGSIVNSPVIIVTTPTFNFGLCAIGENSIQEFSVENVGVGNLIGTITLPQDMDFFISNGAGNWIKSLNFSISSGNTQNFEIAFIPTQVGSFSGEMIITSNSSINPMLNFTLTGEGTNFTILEGTISGVLSLANSPYLITDDVYIENSLTIEPGVQVYFTQEGELHVNDGAVLNANGTSASKIMFYSYPSYGLGLSHIAIGTGNSNLEYCDIDGDIIVNSGSLQISHSDIEDIDLCGNFSADVSFNYIDNLATTTFEGFNLTCHNNVISDMYFMLNIPDSVLVENCDILEQLNFCNYSGGLLELHNCIVMGPVYRNGPSASISVTYCDVLGGQGSILGFQSVIYENNIEEDPLFVDPGNGNYNLQPTSPCIDTGDPQNPLDPDGTRADMGAFYYDQQPIVITYPQEGQVIPTQAPTITWNTSGLGPNESLILEISHIQGLTKQYSNLKSIYQRCLAMIVDFFDVEPAYAEGIKVMTGPVIDLQVTIPNTGTYTVPPDILYPNINYTLKISSVANPDLSDTVHFTTSSNP